MDTIFEDSSDDYGCHPSQTMKNYIDLNMEASLFPKTPSKFLPEGLIEEIFSLDLPGAESTQNAQERVLWILEIQTKGDRELALADFIVGKARRIFLICIYCGLSAKELIHAMSIFMDHPFDDNNLPIPSADFERPVKVDKDPFGTMERDLPASGIVKGRHRLSRPSRILFIKNQHHFLAPVFSTTTLIHDLGERILPFIGDPGRIGLTREGLFGSVSEFTVHPSHFRDNQQQRSNPSYVIAVKEFKEGSYNSAQWENEARALEKMNTIHHDHIVRFMTAFRHNNMTAFRRDEGPNLGHLFCFEWADSGKVADMWNKDPQPLLSASLIRAVIQQLCGLAQALEATHYFKESDGKTPRNHSFMVISNRGTFFGSEMMGELEL